MAIPERPASHVRAKPPESAAAEPESRAQPPKAQPLPAEEPAAAPTGTFLDRRTAATWTTQEPSLRVPPDLMHSGGTYAFLITAEQRSDFDPQAPLRGGPTSSQADAFTSPIIP